MLGFGGSQEGVTEPLGLDLLMAVSFHVGAGHPKQVLCKSEVLCKSAKCS